MALAAAFLLVLAALAFFLFPPADRRVVRFTVHHAAGVEDFAVSPDGLRLAFAAPDEAGACVLWVRPLDSVTARPLPGTDGVRFPFWSPDSRFLGFFAQGKLKRVDAAGGAPFTLCDAGRGQGGSWSRDAGIVFAPHPSSELYRVSAAGGAPESATRLDGGRGVIAHQRPAFLPNGSLFLFSARTKGQQ